MKPDHDVAIGSNPRQHWALAVLSLLRERPMHPYEMRRVMKLRHKDERLDLKPGSLYNAVTWLLKQGLIEVEGEGREGRRPERTTYRATDEGERRLTSWVQQMLAAPRRDVSSFSVALDHLVQIAPAEAEAALRLRAEALAQALSEREAVVQRLAPKIGRINLIESEHDLALERAELAWIEGLLVDLRRGRFAWNTQEILRWARQEAAGGDPTKAPAPRKRRTK